MASVRALAVAAAALLACSGGVPPPRPTASVDAVRPAAAPAPRVPPADAGAAAPSGAPPVDGGPGARGAPDLSGGLGDDAFPPALLRRLAREADVQPHGTPRLAPPPDPERDRAIRRRFGSKCRLERTCGPLWGIDCEAAVDGPYYYVRPTIDALREIATCGGACMGGRCTNCPPRGEGWTCPTY